MLMALVEKDNEYCILCEDGSIMEVNRNNLKKLLFDFKEYQKFSGLSGYWKDKYDNMEDYGEKIYAYVNDKRQLVIKDSAPFMDLIRYDINEYMSVAEYATKEEKDTSRIRTLAAKGKLKGAIKLGGHGEWLIPKDCPYPSDNRKAYYKDPHYKNSDIVKAVTRKYK